MRTPKIVTVIAIEGLALEKLYIPDGDGDATTTGKGLDEASKTFIYDLVDESLKLTGNLDEEEAGDALSARRRKWTPAGTIRVFDDNFRRLCWCGRA